jgi:hypothetical protein
VVTIVTTEMTETKVAITGLKKYRVYGNVGLQTLESEFGTPSWKEGIWKLCVL